MFPLFQCHACKLAISLRYEAKCMTTINIYIYIFFINLQRNSSSCEKNCTCNTPFLQLAMQQNVALQVAEKVELSSTFRNVARQVAACNISSTTCNAIVLESANQSKSTGVVTAEILIIQRARFKFLCNLQMFFIRHRCAASCLRVTWPYTRWASPTVSSLLLSRYLDGQRTTQMRRGETAERPPIYRIIKAIKSVFSDQFTHGFYLWAASLFHLSLF